ncbi:hypothetical protein CPJCM30710_18160 [Clostridium polyendosporum]|uniref:Uncharacterized protein n=1 Tax=Clostridium polyendosporum TaxID=69208 RepID=A0A919RZ04_9CLOT|nr:hypothetical protein [Clostridium polyendosporum]GIM29150.1 hypothetical protein CPJCM30710_18160 [Clostridium polyendosporum]
MGRRSSTRGKVKDPTDFSYLINKPEEENNTNNEIKTGSEKKEE